MNEDKLKDDIINPNEYTVKELIKMLWKDVRQLRIDLEKYEEMYNKSNKLLEKRVEVLEDWKKDVQGKKSGIMDFGKVLGWFVAAVLALFQIIRFIMGLPI